jgi:integrase
MARFRSSQSQARHAVKESLAIGKSSHEKRKDDFSIYSLGTARTYTDSLTCVANFIVENRLDTAGKGLASLSKEVALIYLEHRSQIVGQKQLDKDRQAIQVHLREPLPAFESEIESALQSRAYTHQQAQLIASAQSQKHSFSTKLAADAGIRAHELLTLMRGDERAPSGHRDWHLDRFKGCNDIVRYSTKGKGGLIREVSISKSLSDHLETLRLKSPRIVTDREIFYTQFYDVGGGKQWTDSFTKASARVLGWTSGAHGLRHSYAQRRMNQLQNLGLNYERALAIVSQEMGHFRPEITEVYLR